MSDKFIKQTLQTLISSHKKAGQPLRLRPEGIVKYISRQVEHGARLSGRQIRNMVDMALALATQDESGRSNEPWPSVSASGIQSGNYKAKDKIVINKRHFVPLLKSRDWFREYLAQARGASDETLATQLGLRMDEFDALDAEVQVDTKRHSKRKSKYPISSPDVSTSEEDSS